jgi:hypothetical protein
MRTFVYGYCKSQEINEDFNPDYTPIGLAEADMYDMKQEYMCSIFDHVLKTSDGIALFCKLYNTNDAKELWKEFVSNEYLSTKAKHTGNEILTCFSSENFDRRPLLQIQMIYLLKRRSHR